MRAVRFDRYGGPEVLETREVEDPTAGPWEVLVEVYAAGLNPGEIAIREGFAHEKWPADVPSGQGSDFAGVVRAAGDEVEEFAAGDEVLGWTERRRGAGLDRAATRCWAGPSGVPCRPSWSSPRPPR